ncbi:hypothetical protein FA95DRAFT_1613765, partial [Auriscalpium vulgare]
AIVSPIFETLFTVSPESRAAFAEWGGILISDIAPPTSAPLDPTFSVRPVAGFTFPSNRDHSRQLSRLCEGALWAAFESGRTSVPQYRRSLGELCLAAHPTGRRAGIDATVHAEFIAAMNACASALQRLNGGEEALLSEVHRLSYSTTGISLPDLLRTLAYPLSDTLITHTTETVATLASIYGTIAQVARPDDRRARGRWGPYADAFDSADGFLEAAAAAYLRDAL